MTEIPAGFLFSGINCGIKKKKKDLGLICAENLAQGVFYFTANSFKAAPLIACAKKLKRTSGRLKALMVNSGNANCFTGKQGIKDAEDICKALAGILKTGADTVLPLSTGIIGRRLEVAKIKSSLSHLVKNLSREKVLDFAGAILTTDTKLKVVSEKVKIGRQYVRILGIAKGAGMIFPQLKKQATMLAFVLTDANISKSLLAKASRCCVEGCFNSITVDGCTSTNDTVAFITSKKSEVIKKNSAGFDRFSLALCKVCFALAYKIIEDAEGAGKVIQVSVKKAKSLSQAKRAALSIANSVLFRAAMHGNNPNAGRIIQALGQERIVSSGDNVKVKFDFSARKKTVCEVVINKGDKSWSVLTSDLSPEYVRINAEYN